MPKSRPSCADSLGTLHQVRRRQTFARVLKVSPKQKAQPSVKQLLSIAMRKRALLTGHSAGLPAPALADEDERKVALVLEHGLRSEQIAAEAFVASSSLGRLSLTNYQQRIEALRLFGHPLVGVGVESFSRGLKSITIPRLVFVQTHACARKHCVVSALLSTAIRLPGMSIGMFGIVSA